MTREPFSLKKVFSSGLWVFNTSIFWLSYSLISQFLWSFRGLSSILKTSIPHVTLVYFAVCCNIWFGTLSTLAVGGGFFNFRNNYVKLSNNLWMLLWKCAVGFIGKHTDYHNLNWGVSWARTSVPQLLSIWKICFPTKYKKHFSISKPESLCK